MTASEALSLPRAVFTYYLINEARAVRYLVITSGPVGQSGGAKAHHIYLN